MTKVIGLAGTIGSGKTLASAMLQELGAAIIDADALSRLVVQPQRPAYQDICATFGGEYLLPDGTINRKKLAGLIFADSAARAKLNAITHPRIRNEAAALIDSYRSDNYSMIVLEAALLLETGSFRDLLDETWLVTAPEEQIYKRLAQRDALTPQQAAARLATQMPVQQQAKLASRVIMNDGSLEDLRQRLTLLYEETVQTSS